MKITYTPNPLETTVELDATEIEMLRLKLKLEQYEELLFSAHFHLTEPRFLDLDKAKKELDPDYWCNDEEGKKDHSRLDSRVDELLEHYVEELKLGHAGDCTCFAMSCSKCHAEQLIGVDTLKPYPGKHQLHKIASVFSRWNAETKQHDLPEVTLDEAIAKLAAYTPSASWVGWEQHADRWARENADALTYLTNYRNTHFGD